MLCLRVVGSKVLVGGSCTSVPLEPAKAERSLVCEPLPKGGTGGSPYEPASVL